MFHELSRRIVVLAIVLTFISPLGACAASESNTPFCAGENCAQTRDTFKNICEFILKEKAEYPTIYVGGYYMRDLIAGYEIFGDRRYLDAATAYGDYLLSKQMPNGFWPTGYGPVYLADTGSALGLLTSLYKHVDHAHQKKYFAAVHRYVNSIQKDGMIQPNGSFGTGWKAAIGNTLSGPMYDQYTLSTALTGAEIFIWMYRQTKQDEYRRVAYHAMQWVISTMREDGNIPYVRASEEGADWSKRGDPKVDYYLYTKMRYGTAAYVGEGIMYFDLYCNNPAMKSWIEKAIQPNIEFLLRTQLPDGTWSSLGQKSWDRTRGPGLVSYLIWDYEHIDKDPRIAQAIQRFDAFVVDPEKGKSFGLLNDGADFGPKDVQLAFNSSTCLTGRAIADILSPGVNAKW